LICLFVGYCVNTRQNRTLGDVTIEKAIELP